MWKLATWRPGSDSSAGSHCVASGSSASAPSATDSLHSRLAKGARRAAGGMRSVSTTATSAPPTLAPSTRAKARLVGTTPAMASDTTSRIIATEECAAQVSRAPRKSASSGSPASPASTEARPSDSRSAAEERPIRVSDSSSRPSPTAARPRCLGMGRSQPMKAMTPPRISSGESRCTSNDSACTTRLEPRSAPRMTMRPLAVPTRPCCAKEARISTVAVALCTASATRKPTPKARGGCARALPSQCLSSPPKARRMPVLTMRVAQSSSATPPAMSMRISWPKERSFAPEWGGRPPLRKRQRAASVPTL